MRSVIEKWKDKLGLHLWSIGTQEIVSEQVVYPDDCVGDERFFIGVEKDHDRFEATIYHDVPLDEESIVHELLHIAFPQAEDEEYEEYEQFIAKMAKDTILLYEMN